MKKIIFLLAITLFASFSILNAQSFVQKPQDEFSGIVYNQPLENTRAELTLGYVPGNGIYYGAFGYGTVPVGTNYLSGCVYFSAAQTANYVGASLHTIKYYLPASSSLANMTGFKVWLKNALDGAIVYTQDVTVSSLTYDAPNLIPLTTPYTITYAPLVIGYTAIFTLTTAGGRYPFSVETANAPYPSGSYQVMQSQSAASYGAGASWGTSTDRALMLWGLVTGNALPTNDLACASVTSVPLKWPGNNNVTFNVNVYNAGTAAQNNYTVQLLDATDNVLASAPVNKSIAAGAFASTTFYFTPTVAGNISVKGKVILTGDEGPNNNVSPVLTHKVYDMQPMAYCGYAEEGSIGTSGTYDTYHAAIGFPATNMNLFTGSQINAFEILLGAAPYVNATLWIRSSLTGSNIYQQTFTPVTGWNSITLNTPFVIPTSGDVYLGYTVILSTLGGYPIGTTANPQNASNGGHLQLGTTAWQSLSSNSLPGNVGIIGVMAPRTTAYISTTALPATGGTVIGGGVFNIGQTVTLTASAKPNFVFGGWSDGVNTPTRTFTALGNAAYTANFYKNFTDCTPDQSIHGTATTSGYQIPINTFYQHSYVQHIYTEAELGLTTCDLIHEVSFEYIHATSQGPGGKNNQTIYLGCTTKDGFTGTEWVPVSQMQKVYSGTVQYNNSQPWCTIEFDEPFYYTGGNLVLAVLNNHGTYNTSSDPTFRYSVPSGTRKTQHYYVDGGVHINPVTLTATSTTITNRANTKFGTCKSDYNPNADMAITAFTGELNPMTTKPYNYDVTVKKMGTTPANSYTVSIETDAGLVLASQNVTTPLAGGATANYTFTVTIPHNLAGTLTIMAKVAWAGDEHSCNNTKLLALNVTPHPGYELNCDEKQVGTGTTGIPFCVANLYYYQSYSQQIYDAADIGAAGVINSIAFDYNHTTTYSFTTWDIYMQMIPPGQNFNASTTSWIPVTAGNLVYRGAFSVVPGQKTKCILNQNVPFVYDGVSSILVTVHRPTGTSQYTGSSSSPFWRSTSTGTEYKAMGVGADGATYNIGGPTQTGTRYYTRPNALFEMCSKVYTLNPNNILGVGAEITVTSTPYPAPEGGSISVQFSCNDACYQISDVIIDGDSKGPITTWTFTNVPAPWTLIPIIEVVTTQIPFPITTFAGPNGTINPGPGIVNVPCGDDQTFTFLPDLGYVIDYFEVDGAVKPKKGFYKFTNVTEPHTISVYFKPAPYNITFTHVGDGEVIPVGRENEIPNGQIGMDDGDNQLFLFVPGAHSYIKAVYIDNMLNPMAAVTGSFIFANVHENHSVHVVFELVDLIINATAGPNGKITPQGNVPVPYGSDRPFTVQANQGYVINEVFVDGVSLGGFDQHITYIYTFEEVVANHTIYATFKPATWEIAVSWTDCGNSMLTPSGTGGIVYVPNNAIQTITFVPDEGCKVTGVFVNGESKPASIPTGSYTFYYVAAHQTIHVIFEKIKYQVKSSINDHGVVTPNGITMVEHGADQTYTWYTFPGYEVVNVFVDGLNNTAAVAAGAYTFESVKAPHTIDVITAPLVYKISAVAETGGFITPSGEITVGYNQNQVFTFKAASGYEIDKVWIDGMVNAEAAINGLYAFLNVKENHTIKITFKVSRYFVEATAATGGMIEPAGITELTYFDEIIYTITPEEGYKISYVLVNGENRGPITTFTFNEVEANGSIDAFFEILEIIGIDPVNNELSIYSHSNTVYIVNNALIPINEVSIIDMYGRVVWKGNVYVERNAIQLNVANGIYTVRVTTDDGFITSKVNIQR